MDNIAIAAQLSLSIISLMVYEVHMLTNKSKYSHVTNLFFFVLTYANYVVTEMFQKFKMPTTTPSIEYLQSMVSVSVWCLIQ